MMDWFSSVSLSFVLSNSCPSLRYFRTKIRFILSKVEVCVCMCVCQNERPSTAAQCSRSYTIFACSALKCSV